MGIRFTIMAAAVVLWPPHGDLLRVEQNDEAMGATFSIVLYGDDRGQMEKAADAAFDEVHRLDRLLSNYKPDSEWSEVNRTAGVRPVKVSTELFQLLSECLKYSRQSDGAFDITVGPLMKVWGFYKGEGALPRPADVTDALARVGHRHVRLDASARTIRFDRAGVELDPGGIGKGYAVDKMVEVLRRSGIHVALVSAAGSSIYGLGALPDEPRGWPITIRAPDDPNKSAAEVFLRDMSLSTSGSYEKFFWADGRTYAHIIDPRTGHPASGMASVSVVAPRTIDSEAWAKPFFINGRTWTAGHKPANFRVFACDDAKPSTCSWIGSAQPQRSKRLRHVKRVGAGRPPHIALPGIGAGDPEEADA
jgi:thiamine biosynthesis lipoprotein